MSTTMWAVGVDSGCEAFGAAACGGEGSGRVYHLGTMLDRCKRVYMAGRHVCIIMALVGQAGDARRETAIPASTCPSPPHQSLR